MRHTAVLTGRYLRNTMEGSRTRRTVNRVTGLRREPRQQDVMFGLMVIQQRLGAMENRLGEMEGQLAGIERRITELTTRDEPSAVDDEGRFGAANFDRLQDPVGCG